MTKLVDGKQEGCQWCLAGWYHCPRQSELGDFHTWSTTVRDAKQKCNTQKIQHFLLAKQSECCPRNKDVFEKQESTRELKGRLITRSNIDSQRAWFLAFYFFDSDFQPGESANYLFTAHQKGRAEKPVLTNAQTALQMTSLLVRRNNQGQWGDSAKTTGHFSPHGEVHTHRANCRTSQCFHTQAPAGLSPPPPLPSFVFLKLAILLFFFYIQKQEEKQMK